jgi:hypothetical protein
MQLSRLNHAIYRISRFSYVKLRHKPEMVQTVMFHDGFQCDSTATKCKSLDIN